MTMIAHVDTRRRNGLVFGIIVVMAHLSVATYAGRRDQPWPVESWPMLLSSDPISIDPVVALLHQRANESLDKLVQSARAPEQPL
jgi:hypothetical protein